MTGWRSGEAAAFLALSGEEAKSRADWAAAAVFFFGENEMFFSFCSADDAGEGGGCMAGAPSSNWRSKRFNTG